MGLIHDFGVGGGGQEFKEKQKAIWKGDVIPVVNSGFQIWGLIKKKTAVLHNELY